MNIHQESLSIFKPKNLRLELWSDSSLFELLAPVQPPLLGGGVAPLGCRPSAIPELSQFQVIRACLSFSPLQSLSHVRLFVTPWIEARQAAATAHIVWEAATAHIARPRGATPCPRPGAEAGRTPCPKGGGQEELPHIRDQGQQPRVPGCDGTGTVERSYPMSEVRGSSQEEQPHLQGAVAVWAQEGLVELFHVQGPEGQQWEDTPPPR